MKLYHTMIAAVAVGAIMIGFQSTSVAQQSLSPTSGCTPNGNRFDLEPLTNAAFYGQYNEAIAVIPNRGGNRLVEIGRAHV